MFQRVAVFIFLFFLVLCQISFFPAVLPGGISPDLLLLLAVFLVTKEGFESSVSRIILAGLIYELMIFQPIGAKIFSLTIVAFLMGYFSKRFLVSQRNWRASFLLILIFSGTLLDHFFLNGLVATSDYFKKSIPFSFALFMHAVIWKKVALNLLFAPLAYYTFKKIDRHIGLLAR